MNAALKPLAGEEKSLVKKVAARFGVDADKLLATLKATAFKQSDDDIEITNEHMMALLVIADQYGLNPFTRELYAFPDKKGKGITPVVGVDGWSRIINEHPKYDGMEIYYSDTLVTPTGAKVACHEWVEVHIFRKDISRPIKIREYLDEVYRPPFSAPSKFNKNENYTVDGPWQTHPKRFLRHKGIIQCARIALGFTGIYDPDEADRIRDMGQAVVINRNDVVDNSAPIQLEYQKLDALSEQLIERVKPQKAWSAAYEWAEGRFSGQEHEYIRQKIRDAEIESMPSALSEFDQQTQNQDDVPPGTERFEHDGFNSHEGSLSANADGDLFNDNEAHHH